MITNTPRNAELRTLQSPERTSMRPLCGTVASAAGSASVATGQGARAESRQRPGGDGRGGADAGGGAGAGEAGTALGLVCGRSVAGKRCRNWERSTAALGVENRKHDARAQPLDPRAGY
jgi:hypothetical protein